MEQNNKEQDKLSNFTFYESYYETMEVLDYEKRGEFIRLIIDFMTTNNDSKVIKDKQVRFLFSSIIDTLKASKKRELLGKKAVSLNREMKHFNFHQNFIDAISLVDNETAGIYLTALCKYMLENTEIELSGIAEGYFKVAKRILNKSRMRSKLGRLGGSQEKYVSAKVINEMTKNKHYNFTIENFLQHYPHIRNDIKPHNKQLFNGVDWANLLGYLNGNSKYENETSLYRILKNYDEIKSE